MATQISTATIVGDEEEAAGPRRFRGRPELLLTPLSFLLFLGVWEWVVHQYAITAILLPPPSRILRVLFDGLASGLYLKHFLVTVGDCLATSVPEERDPLHPLPTPLLRREAYRAIFNPPASPVSAADDPRR